MNHLFAGRMSRMKSSDIREILKFTKNPEVISFAGGLPAPEHFPVAEVIEANRLVLEEEGAKALQYAPTEGYLPLRTWIAERMNRILQTTYTADEILITNGAQQALDLTGMVFLDPGDIVVCESPTYMAALSAFKAYECRFLEVPTDEEGMDPAVLEDILSRHEQVKLIYTVPDFQNPTGRTWSAERRKQVAALAERFGVMIVEDNPYGELRFEGEALPSIRSFVRSGQVVNLGTFSKIFCPGYRIGWIAGNAELISKFVQVKQGVDLQSSTLSQMVISKYLELNDIDVQIARIVETYRSRRDTAIRTMEEVFPDSIAFTRPQGGLFIWVELPEYLNARELLERCIEHNVAFVPGGAFFPNSSRENTLRINFSFMDEGLIEQGLTTMGEVIREMVQATCAFV